MFYIPSPLLSRIKSNSNQECLENPNPMPELKPSSLAGHRIRTRSSPGRRRSNACPSEIPSSPSMASRRSSPTFAGFASNSNSLHDPNPDPNPYSTVSFSRFSLRTPLIPIRARPFNASNLLFPLGLRFLNQSIIDASSLNFCTFSLQTKTLIFPKFVLLDWRCLMQSQLF